MTERILIVDDEQAVRDTMAVLLRNEGYRVVAADGGHEAVSAIEAYMFDVVIVDIFMPAMSGIDTIRIFHKEAPHVRIIAMSGYPPGAVIEDDFFRSAMENGATCCLRKPFTREQLLDALAFCRASLVA